MDISFHVYCLQRKIQDGYHFNSSNKILLKNTKDGSKWPFWISSSHFCGLKNQWEIFLIKCIRINRICKIFYQAFPEDACLKASQLFPYTKNRVTEKSIHWSLTTRFLNNKQIQRSVTNVCHNVSHLSSSFFHVNTIGFSSIGFSSLRQKRETLLSNNAIVSCASRNIYIYIYIYIQISFIKTLKHSLHHNNTTWEAYFIILLAKYFQLLVLDCWSVPEAGTLRCSIKRCS